MFAPSADAASGGCCSGGGNETHSDNDRVQDPPRQTVVPPAPVCTLVASATSIKAGQSVTLSWSTANAISVSLSGVGAVAKSGSVTVSPAQTTTYTLTITGYQLGDRLVTKTCVVTITVLPKDEEPKNPYCDMSGAPSTIKKGQSATISWSTTNVTSASIDQGVGNVAVDGSRSVSPSQTTTYTGSFTGYGKTVICKTTIKVDKDEEHEDDDLWCKLKVSDDDIRKGERVKLSWDSKGADHGKINEGIGRVDEEGYEYVYPKEDTTYKATFYGEHDEDDTVTCKVEVEVEKAKHIPPPPQTPYITLSSVPYTGLDLGPVGTAVYWAFLMLWSVLAAYLIAVKRVHVGIYHFLFGKTASQTVSQSPLVKPSLNQTIAPQSAPALDMDPFLASQIYKKS
jgi:hypothetical protein